MSVAWVGVGVSAVGAIGSYLNGKKASSAANAAAAQQAALQQQQLAFNQRMYEEEKAKQAPAIGFLQTALTSKTPVNWGQTSGFINKQFDRAERGTTEALGRSGLLGSGVQAATTQGNRLKLATTLSEAWLKGNTDKFGIAGTLLNAANPIAAANGVNSAFSGMAGAAGDRAGMYRQRASDSYGAMAANLSQGMGFLYDKYGKPKTTTTPATGGAR